MPTQRWKQQAAHLAFFDQVAGALVNMGEAVDTFAAEVGGGGHQVLVFGLVGHFVGHGHGVHGGPDDGVIDHVLDPLAEKVNVEIQFSEALFVLGGSHHCHLRVSLFSSGYRMAARRSCSSPFVYAPYPAFHATSKIAETDGTAFTEKALEDSLPQRLLKSLIWLLIFCIKPQDY